MTNEELAALDAAAREAMDRAMVLADTPGNHDAIIIAKAQNAAAHDKLAYHLVNLYRAGKLVLVPSVEEVIAAIGSFWMANNGEPDIHGDYWVLHHGKRHTSFRNCDDAYEFAQKMCATAVIASTGAKTDGN